MQSFTNLHFNIFVHVNLIQLEYFTKKSKCKSQGNIDRWNFMFYNMWSTFKRKSLVLAITGKPNYFRVGVILVV